MPTPSTTSLKLVTLVALLAIVPSSTSVLHAEETTPKPNNGTCGVPSVIHAVCTSGYSGGLKYLECVDRTGEVHRFIIDKV